MYGDADVRAARAGIKSFFPAFVVLAQNLVFAAPVDAAVRISSDATSNMSCGNGICSPTAMDAVLNVGDLENLLATGNVRVTTTGTTVQADNIEVEAELSWSSDSTLTFDAYDSISIGKPVSVAGPGGLTLATSDGGTGGTLAFVGRGHVAFRNLSSVLTINGAPYTLVDSVGSLASAISESPGGNYALASDYDASRDGTYPTSPIGTTFTGVFEGLGNRIENLAIKDDHQESAALFGESSGTIRDVGVVNVSITSLSTDTQAVVAGLVAENRGTVTQSYSTGAVTSDARNDGPSGGGLVGSNDGSISLSYSTATVTGNEYEGGLSAENWGGVTESFATGNASGGLVGGLIGYNGAAVAESYAAGYVFGQISSNAGGLVGYNATDATIGESYATGKVSGEWKGGLIGYDYSSPGSNSDCYWDTTTSHIPVGQGAGHPLNDPGIAGFTSKQLRAKLPKGFDHKFWAEKDGINRGFPYLLANPPPR